MSKWNLISSLKQRNFIYFIFRSGFDGLFCLTLSLVELTRLTLLMIVFNVGIRLNARYFTRTQLVHSELGCISS
jgi:hypothetical protein